MNQAEIIIKLKECQIRSGFSRDNIVRKVNWTSGEYLKYRFLRPLVKIKFKSFRFKHRPSPWIAPAATLFFEDWLTKDKKGAEFGSGISTVFFAKRTAKMVSIEHFEPWYNKVKNEFETANIENVDYLFIPQDKSRKEQPFPQSFVELGCKEKDLSVRWDYQDYFNGLNNYDNEFFDFILVDGRARPECLFSSISKLKKGGLMILDNSERDRYSIVFDILSKWRSFTTSTGLTDTTFWIKPD